MYLKIIIYCYSYFSYPYTLYKYPFVVRVQHYSSYKSSYHINITSNLFNIYMHLISLSCKTVLKAAVQRVCMKSVMILTLGPLWSPTALNTGKRNAVVFKREEMCVNFNKQILWAVRLKKGLFQ